MKNSFFLRPLVLGLLCAQLSAQVEVVSGGNVGVGTNSPGQKLSVSGANGAPGTTGTSADSALRLGSSVTNLVLDAGVSGGSGAFAWLQARSQASYADNFNLSLNPNGGNVGIGTSDPGSRRVKVETSGAANDVGLDVTIGRTTGTNYGLLVNAGGGGASFNQGILTTAGGAAANIGLRIYNVAAGANNYALYSDSAAQSYFQGNVGIGGSPGQKLTINGSHGDTLVRLFSDAYGQGVGGANTALLSLWASEPGWTWTGAGIGNNFVPTARITTTRGASYMRLLDNGILICTMDSSGNDKGGIAVTDGNVGIGTASPSQKLQVAGSVRATSFISDTQTYADFVFRPDYRLAPLSEVEAHIRDHGHLPGIPSEAEARANGIDLTAMQVKLLQKVEELTLHQIAQGKRIQALEQENARLRNEP